MIGRFSPYLKAFRGQTPVCHSHQATPRRLPGHPTSGRVRHAPAHHGI